MIRMNGISKRGTMRRLGWLCLALLVMLGAIVSLGIVPPASADNGSCGFFHDGNRVCLYVVGDSPYMTGAHISIERWLPGCVTGRFYHLIREDGNPIPIAEWSDDGEFQVCQYDPKTYYWTHAGGGAYVPEGSYVLGKFVRSDGLYSVYSLPIFWF